MSIFRTIKSPKPTRRFLLVTLLLSMALTACGYRGPLYLPNEDPVEPATSQSATENTDDDADEEEEGPGSR